MRKDDFVKELFKALEEQQQGGAEREPERKRRIFKIR